MIQVLKCFNPFLVYFQDISRQMQRVPPTDLPAKPARDARAGPRVPRALFLLHGVRTAATEGGRIRGTTRPVAVSARL